MRTTFNSRDSEETPMGTTRRFRTSTYGMLAMAATLMLASTPSAAQVGGPLDPDEINQIVNQFIGGNQHNEGGHDPQSRNSGGHTNQGQAYGQDPEPEHNPCTTYWERQMPDKYCPNATLTFTEPETCRVEATCSVTTDVLKEDGSFPDQHTTFTASVDWEATTLQDLYQTELCFVPDSATQTYELTMGTPRCPADTRMLTANYGYPDPLPYIRPPDTGGSSNAQNHQALNMDRLISSETE